MLGICSGFQVLAKETDVGRLSTIPITREGLGLLDAEFKPLVCTDRVKATIVDKSFITQDVGKEVAASTVTPTAKLCSTKTLNQSLSHMLIESTTKKTPKT